MKRLTFYGCSAFQGRIDNADGCSFWGEDPNALSYKPERLIGVTFKRTPTTVAIDSWEKPDPIGVQLDDHLAGKGLTTLGPNFLPGSVIRQEGGVYLIRSVWKTMRDKGLLLWPPSNGPAETYQYKVVLRADETAPDPLQTIDRYLGFKVHVRKRSGALVVVDLFRAGSAESTVLTFDLDDPAMCSLHAEIDPEFDGAAEQVMKNNNTVDGALFVNTKYAKALSLFIPKLPPTSGNSPFP